MSSGTAGSVLADRTSNIVALIPEECRPDDIDAKVRAFLRINGIVPVEEAARLLAVRVARGKTPRDPWAFLVDVVNRDHTRANVFQVLVHWLENALRTRIDISLTDEYGDTWHHYLENFVPHPEIRNSRMGVDFFSQAGLVKDNAVLGRARTDVQRHPTGASFLADASLKDLKLITRYCTTDLDRPNRIELREVECFYSGCVPFDAGRSACCAPEHRHSTGRRLTMKDDCRERTRSVPSGSMLFPSRIQSMLGSVYQARNEAAHSRRLGANLHSEAFRDARHLLTSLGFDLTKGTQRFERRRLSDIDDVLKRYGLTDGVNAILRA